MKHKTVTRQYCTFYLSNRLFGADILSVKEINEESDITPIHHAPSEVKGYVNIRGQIFLILDLSMVMGLPSSDTDIDKKLVLFKNGVLEACGILVDDVGDVVKVDPTLIEDRRQGQSADAASQYKEKRKDVHRIGAGVCKLEDQLMVLIDPAGILEYITTQLAAHAHEVAEQ